MGPERLRGWEVVLQSPVAVALLLLAGLICSTGPLLYCVRVLYAENRKRESEFRDHLRATAEFNAALANAKQVLHLAESSDVRTPPAEPPL